MEERDEIFKALLDPKFDPRAKVILESAPQPRPEKSAGGKVSLLSSSSDDLEITADIPRPAILLITDSYARGWRAVPIGPNPQRRYDVMPANYILRAVPLAAGRHHFRLEYAPLSYRIGKWISIISLLVFAALCLRPLLGRWRDYRAPERNPAPI